MKLNQNYTNFIKIYWQLLLASEVSKRLLAFSAILICFASIFQMMGLGLIVPLLNSLVDENHFKGVLYTPILGNILRSLPFPKNQENIFIFMLMLIFFAVVLENLFIYCGRCLNIKLAKDLTTALRVKIYNRFINFNKSFFNNESLSEINTLIVNFIQSATRTTNNITLFLIQGFFALVFLILMFSISWQLTLFSLILLPITHFFANYITKKIKKSAQSAHNSLLDVGNKLEDTLSNIELVQLNNNQDFEKGLFKEYAESESYHSAKARIKGILIPSVLEVINALGALLVVAVSVFLFFSFNSYSLGRLLVFFVSLRRFVSNVEQFTSNIVQTTTEIPNLEKILWALNFQESLPIISGNKELIKIKKEISFKNVNFSYDHTRKILDNISFTVPINKVVALVGPTGAGKTTIINLLPRFFDPLSGKIEFDNEDIKNFTLESLRNDIGLVSQNAKLFNNTIRYNIVYGIKDIDENKYRDALKSAQLDSFINKLPKQDLTIVGSNGVKLSGGEKQRISIARAILKNPQILILDEATSSLDAKTEYELDKALELVLPNRSVFVIAHRLVTIKKADIIFFIDHGSLVEQGSFNELVNKKDKFYQFAVLQNLV